jgi:hypothetical protein
VRLLGLEQGTISWNHNSLGLQSRAFTLCGERWKAREGIQVLINAAATPQAHAKACLAVSQQAFEGMLQPVLRMEAEDTARNLSKSKSRVEQGVVEAHDELDMISEPCAQLRRERNFLRAWAAADSANKLQLPADSLLVVPRLFENVVVNSDEDPYVVKREEEALSVLVMEDLTTAGFKPFVVYDKLSREDGMALVEALADFYAATWRIRSRLGRVNYDELIDKEQAAKAAMSMWQTDDAKQQHRSPLVKLVDSLRNEGQTDAADATEQNIESFVEHMFNDTSRSLSYCHGKIWAHNLLFRRDKDSTKITGVALVDFGGYRLACPVTDLFGFLYTSLNLDVRFSGNNFDFNRAYIARFGSQAAGYVFGPPMLVIPLRTAVHAECTTLAYFVEPELWSITDETSARGVGSFIMAAKAVALQQQTDDKVAGQRSNEGEAVADAGTLRQRKRQV